MPLSCFSESPKFSNEILFYLENSCKAPASMKMEPPLPAGYTAWINRSGWVLYVHDSSKTASWMHPGKLTALESRGVKKIGDHGPEMWIWEKNLNREGYYVIDYAYPPMGKPKSGTRPAPIDFQEINQIGYAAWEAKIKAASAARSQKILDMWEAGEDTSEYHGKMEEGWSQRVAKVKREQGFGVEEDDKTKEMPEEEIQPAT